MVIVLDIGQPVRELADMVIVNESQSTDDGGIGTLRGFLRHSAPYEIAEGFTTVVITVPFDVRVKALQERRGYRDANPFEFTHLFHTTP